MYRTKLIPADGLPQRAQALFEEHRDSIYRRTDKLFGGLLVFQWFCAVGLALVVSPRAWAGGTSHIHPHVWIAVLYGAAIVTLPLALILLRPGRASTRHIVAASQVIFSAILIHLSGGRIETHFHVFGSLAFLAFYRDWRVLITASAIVAVDHFVRGVVWPESVYGLMTANPYRWLEHAAWVIFEDVFLIMSCLQSQTEMKCIALRQTELESANALAEAASRTKSEFLANMSHEIRTPMTAILGYTDLLMQPGAVAQDVTTWIQTIRRNSDHLLSLINDILDLSKIEAGKMTVEQITCSPLSLLEEVASLMRVRAVERGLSFELECLTPIPAQIQSDPTRIRQVLLNLTANAIKFTRRGSVRLQCRFNPDEHPQRLVFEVVDTGIGMTPDQIAQLFQPFTQADGSMTRRFGGTGLGLTISKFFVERLGGTLSLQSMPDLGSRFTATIDPGPLVGVPLVREQSPATMAGAIHIAGSAAGTLSGRLLVAEDGPDNQQLLRWYLTRAGVAATIVADGKSALDRIMEAEKTAEPFDAIILDMQMPILDGYSTAAALRTQGFTKPIIALTAHAMAGDRDKCLNAGCSDYVVKPIKPAELSAALQRALPSPGATKAPGQPEQFLLDNPELSAMLQSFVATLPTRARDLAAAAAANDRGRVAVLSHQLSGVAGSYGFPGISTAAAALEQAIEDELSSYQKQVDELITVCTTAVAARHAAPAR
jgi:signal transduction histidine kinase/DNA-binding response OmpR family regulator